MIIFNEFKEFVISNPQKVYGGISYWNCDCNQVSNGAGFMVNEGLSGTGGSETSQEDVFHHMSDLCGSSSFTCTS